MKEKIFIAFIVLVGALPPLSTDLPLPALPEIASFFGVEDIATTMVLVAFFVTYAFSTLLWGPLSDKYGRKPMLLIGFAIYLIGSFLCGIATSVDSLIIFRAIQGLGGGCSMTVTSAIVRDVYTGKKQESILAIVQSMTMVCPLVAPVLGALLQTLISWRGVFFAQAIMGLVIVAGAIIMKETNKERLDVKILGALARLVPVMRHGKFMLMVISFSLPFVGIMAWVSSSSYIYANDFGLSSQVYSYFFALTSVGAIAGPLAYIWISKKFKRYNIITVCLIESLIAGIAIILFGANSPMILALLILPTTFAIGAIRPPTTYMMLNNKEGDSGSAAALIGAVSSICGIIGMIVVVLFSDYVFGIGFLFVIISIITLTVWLTSFRNTKEEDKLQ